ncbi:predicted protein [Plenodomus lingam JN3]|uniref:Predicted protein n=1 Tax=Leptosphaeria maculans (strain JN3 / isolate v23.1.3 / race Av1-4-5-6-7-8) TaxID=985895 RepID=E5AAQ0_LEPMJ|nr:predicted protein [Plenodomus lingam JN3]CBY00741.1 predicted protein [Plenodomus lingam JN3]
MLLRYLLIWPHICIFACLPCPALPASSGMSVLVRRPRGSPAVVWGWVNTTHLLDTNCYAGCRFEHAQPKIALTGRWRQIPGDFDSFVLEFGYTFTSPTQLVYTE